MDILEALEIKEENKWNKVSGFMKIGKSFSFKNLDQNRHSVGDWECVKLLQLLSNKEPHTKFVIMTASNFNKLTPQERYNLFPNNNVFNRSDIKVQKSNKCNRMILDPICNEVQEVYIINGPSGTRNGNIKFRKKNGELCSFIEMTLNYVSHAYNWLNRNPDVPSIMLVTDTRYFPYGYDYINTPDIVVSQFSKEGTVYEGKLKHIENIEDKTCDKNEIKFHSYKIENARIESLWLLGKNKPEWFNDDSKLTERSNKVLIVANQVKSNFLNKRYEIIRDYIVHQNIDANLVGKWNHEIALNEFKDILYDKDGVSESVLNTEIIPNHRIGLIIKYDSVISGIKYDSDDNWVVSKLWEYLYHGVIPILIGFNGKYANVPSMLMVNSKEELKETIDLVLSFDEKCTREIINRIMKPEFFSGNDLYNRINELKSKYFRK